MDGPAACPAVPPSKAPADRAALQKKWKHQVRKLPLAQRFAWLKGEEGMAAFSARQRWEKLRAIRTEILTLMSSVPSSSWQRAAEFAGEAFPVPGMVLSRGRVRIGDQAVATRRWTAGIAVQVEDLLDRMDVLRANHYLYPPSITGLQMELIGWRRGRDNTTSAGRRLRCRGDKSRKVELGFGNGKISHG